MPSAQLSGIYANKPGYHNCRNQLPSSDYSVQKSYDQKGDGWAAGALDITLSDADMKRVTQRLIDATKAGEGNGGKLRALRSFFGTVDGYSVTGMDVPGAYWITSDDSHLWHVHASTRRELANDEAAWADVAAVMTGGAAPSTGEDEDMPKQMYLYSKSGQTTKLAKSGTWYCVNWDADLGYTGGYGLSLPSKTSLFSLSAWLYCTGLGLDDSLYWRVQTLDRDNQELAKYPIGELRATSGDTDLAFSQVGSVSASKDTNLRILVAATRDNVTVKSAWWRTLYW